MKVKINNHFVEMYRIDRLNEILDIDEELKKWIDKCKESKIEGMIDASNTIENWLDEVVNSFIEFFSHI